MITINEYNFINSSSDSNDHCKIPKLHTDSSAAVYEKFFYNFKVNTI